jgi:glycerophosphoryl diester phosphodiesterase
MRSRIARILLVVLVLVVVVVGGLLITARKAPAYPVYSALPANRPLVIAHQGGDGVWPGESMLAFDESVKLGVDMLEADIHMTRDGVLVLLHDETVDRTTDGSGLIKEMTLDQIKALDAAYDWSPDGGKTFPYRGQGVQIATVEELFTAHGNVPMVLEIKQAQPSIAGPLCDLLKSHDMQDKLIVGSFSEESVDDFRRVCPEVATSAAEDEVRTFFIMNTLFLGGAYTPAATAMQVPEYNSGLHVVTAGFIAAARARGMQVHVWTVNEEADMQRMVELGVDGIITDRPDRLVRLLGR